MRWPVIATGAIGGTLRGVLAFMLTALGFVTAPVAAAEPLLYDVDTAEYAMFMRPLLRATASQRIQIIDNGPQGAPEVTPRWESASFSVWDVPGGGWAANMDLFGKNCGDLPGYFGPVVDRAVQDDFGGGDFAWVPGQNPLDGSIDPHAFFCLKGSHQSTTTWTEWVSVGRRVYDQTPTPPAVTITRPTESQVVSGTTRIDIATTGLGAGSRNYVLIVDGSQRQYGTTSTNSFTLWFNTTRVSNGAHVFVVRITQAGASAEDGVAVVVRN